MTFQPIRFPTYPLIFKPLVQGRQILPSSGLPLSDIDNGSTNTKDVRLSLDTDQLQKGFSENPWDESQQGHRPQ